MNITTLLCFSKLAAWEIRLQENKHLKRLMRGTMEENIRTHDLILNATYLIKTVSYFTSRYSKNSICEYHVIMQVPDYLLQLISALFSLVLCFLQHSISTEYHPKKYFHLLHQSSCQNIISSDYTTTKLQSNIRVSSLNTIKKVVYIVNDLVK